MEGRKNQRMDPLKGKMTDTPRSENISTKRQRIATMDTEVANPCSEEPDAAESARPDLWGAGESDLPGLPDPELLHTSSLTRWGPCRWYSWRNKVAPLRKAHSVVCCQGPPAGQIIGEGAGESKRGVKKTRRSSMTSPSSGGADLSRPFRTNAAHWVRLWLSWAKARVSARGGFRGMGLCRREKVASMASVKVAASKENDRLRTQMS